MNINHMWGVTYMKECVCGSEMSPDSQAHIFFSPLVPSTFMGIWIFNLTSRLFAEVHSDCLRRPEQVPAHGWNDKSRISAYKSFILGINSPRLHYHRQTDCCICPLTKQSLLFNPDTSICYDTVSICQEMWIERRDAEGGAYSVYQADE